MYSYGKTSRHRLETCDDELIAVADELIKLMDVTVIEGYRNKARQDEAFRTKRSQKRWPESKHNIGPSLAVDIAPYYPSRPHILWPSKAIMRNRDAQIFARYAYMIGMARGIAHSKGIKLRSGLDWDSDGELADTSFFDLPHLELT